MTCAASPSPLRGGWPRSGRVEVVAAGCDAFFTPRTAALTPSGAPRHLPLKGGEADRAAHSLLAMWRIVEPNLRQWLCRGLSDIAAGMAGEPAHQRAHIGRPALAEIAEQRFEFFGQRRMRDQPFSSRWRHSPGSSASLMPRSLATALSRSQP